MAADPVQNTGQTTPQEPAAVASASPTPQESVAQQASPTPSEPAPAALPAPADSSNGQAAPPAADAKPSGDAPAADSAQLTLLQEFDKDTKAKEKPTADAKAAEHAKDAKAEPAKPDAENKLAADAKDAAKPAEAKAAEAPKPAEGDKPAEVKAEESAKPAPVEYKYEVPAVLKMDDALKTEVHTLLDEFRADPGKNVQKLIDFHAKSMETYATNLQKQMDQHQRDVFNETRKGWANDVKASDEIGGAGFQTSMGVVARMRDLVAHDMMAARTWDDGSPRKSQLDEFLETTGAGDHPVFLTMLHRFGKYFDEAGLPPPGAQPAPNNGRRKPATMKDLYADGPTKAS